MTFFFLDFFFKKKIFQIFLKNLKNGWSRRFVAWVVCLLMGMGGLEEWVDCLLMGMGGLLVDGYGWITCYNP